MRGKGLRGMKLPGLEGCGARSVRRVRQVLRSGARTTVVAVENAVGENLQLCLPCGRIAWGGRCRPSLCPGGESGVGRSMEAHSAQIDEAGCATSHIPVRLWAHRGEGRTVRLIERRPCPREARSTAGRHRLATEVTSHPVPPRRFEAAYRRPGRSARRSPGPMTYRPARRYNSSSATNPVCTSGRPRRRETNTPRPAGIGRGRTPPRTSPSPGSPARTTPWAPSSLMRCMNAS